MCAMLLQVGVILLCTVCNGTSIHNDKSSVVKGLAGELTVRSRAINQGVVEEAYEWHCVTKHYRGHYYIRRCTVIFKLHHHRRTYQSSKNAHSRFRVRVFHHRSHVFHRNPRLAWRRRLEWRRMLHWFHPRHPFRWHRFHWHLYRHRRGPIHWHHAVQYKVHQPHHHRRKQLKSRFVVGSKVCLTSHWKGFGPMKPGQQGVFVKDAHDSQPYYVRTPDGLYWWYYAKEIGTCHKSYN